jgi:hypothetical protein
MTRYYLFEKEEKLRSEIDRKEANKEWAKGLNDFLFQILPLFISIN